MAHIYPKHLVPKDCTDYAYEKFEPAPTDLVSADPTGLDQAKTYTDLYNVPHEPPRRDR